MEKRYERGLCVLPSKELERETTEAELRQNKARKLLNDYFFWTKDV